MCTFPSIDPVATGLRIKELRIEKKLKVEQISSFMGFESEQAVYKWQRGDSLPTLDNMVALSRLFETPIENIVRVREEDERSSSFDVYEYTSGLLFRTCPLTIITL